MKNRLFAIFLITFLVLIATYVITLNNDLLSWFSIDIYGLFTAWIPALILVISSYNLLKTNNFTKSNIIVKSILPIFTLLYFWIIPISLLISGYGGWSIFYLLPIAYIVLIYGLIISFLSRNKLNNKSNSIFGKYRISYLFGLYLSIFMIGIFFVSDNGDNVGSGSIASNLIGVNTALSQLLAMLFIIASVILMALNLLSIAIYGSNNKS